MGRFKKMLLHIWLVLQHHFKKIIAGSNARRLHHLQDKRTIGFPLDIMILSHDLASEICTLISQNLIIISRINYPVADENSALLNFRFRSCFPVGIENLQEG